jgi:hypothetical protein
LFPEIGKDGPVTCQNKGFRAKFSIFLVLNVYTSSFTSTLASVSVDLMIAERCSPPLASVLNAQNISWTKKEWAVL